MRVLEVQWSRALGLVCEVALTWSPWLHFAIESVQVYQKEKEKKKKHGMLLYLSIEK
jgi:hypothetical protein